MSRTGVRILPLGGLGEIGKNMTAIEAEGRIVVVDTGLMFPTADMLGIDLVLPDFSSLRDRADDIEAIVLTHGHEDHVGALPYVLREIGMPPVIYGGLLTIGMVRSKLDEHKLRDVPLQELPAGESVRAGAFGIELVHMAHSIPDARAVALTTDLGTVLVTGDYKFDQTPVDGIPADVSRLAELGRDGPALPLRRFDQCRPPRGGAVRVKRRPGPARGLLPLPGPHHHHLLRVQHPPRPAGDRRRGSARSARRARRPLDAEELQHRLQPGHGELPDGLFISPKEVQDFPDEKVVVISTGSQGEPLSALRRMAHRDHPDVELHSGDTVIFSATPIPGNERSVNETIDRIFQIGAQVVTARDAPIHASGHGWQEELKLMLNLTKPRNVFPFHGDHKRMRLHADLAESVGIDPDRIFTGRNGLALEIDESGARFGEDVHASMIFVDGVSVGEPDEFALRDRRKLSDDGVFIVVATISSDDGSQVADPEVIFRGVPFAEEADGLRDELRDVVQATLSEAANEDVREVSLLQQDLHDDIAEFVYEKLRRRPLVLPVVVEV